jgi:hypothetical protein
MDMSELRDEEDIIDYSKVPNHSRPERKMQKRSVDPPVATSRVLDVVTPPRAVKPKSIVSTTKPKQPKIIDLVSDEEQVSTNSSKLTKARSTTSLKNQNDVERQNSQKSRKITTQKKTTLQKKKI